LWLKPGRIVGVKKYFGVFTVKGINGGPVLTWVMADGVTRADLN
jgi:hypothetical protein